MGRTEMICKPCGKAADLKAQLVRDGNEISEVQAVHIESMHCDSGTGDTGTHCDCQHRVRENVNVIPSG